MVAQAAEAVLDMVFLLTKKVIATVNQIFYLLITDNSTDTSTV